MTHGDEVPAQRFDRTEALVALGAAVRWWGQDVPDDPGAGELAQLLSELVERLRGDQRAERLRRASEPLAEAVEALRAVDRLGGLLPAVSMWHLRTAVQRETVARSYLAEPREAPRAEPPQSSNLTLS